MTSTPGSDAERGLEAEERHEQARQQGAEEEYDAVHGTDRGVHAPLDAVGRDRLPVGDVIRVFDAHREAVDELRDRDDDQHDGDAGVGGEWREREHEPRDHDQDSAEKDRLAGAEPHADTGRDHRTDEAADAPGREGDAERPRGESQLTKSSVLSTQLATPKEHLVRRRHPTTSMARATQSMSSDSRMSDDRATVVSASDVVTVIRGISALEHPSRPRRQTPIVSRPVVWRSVDGETQPRCVNETGLPAARA